MFRNLLSSGGGDKTVASIKSDTSPPTNTTTTTTSSSRKTPKDQCPHCNHSFFSSLKSHLRLNKSCGTKTLVSEPRINKAKSSSSSSSNNSQNETKSKAMLLMMAKQTKLDNIDSARLSTSNTEPNSSSPSNNIELPPSQ